MPLPSGLRPHPSCKKVANGLRMALTAGALCAAAVSGVVHARLPSSPDAVLERAAPIKAGAAPDSVDADGPPPQAAPDADDAATPAPASPPRAALPEPAPPAPAPASVPKLVDAAAPAALWPHLRVWSTDDHVADPDALLDRLDRFEPPVAPTNNLGRPTQPVWVHAAWEVDAGSDGRWILHLQHAPLDDARIHVYEDGRRLAQVRLGAAQAFADRPLPTRAHTVPLDLRPGTRVDILARLSSRGALVAPFTMEKPATLLRSESRAQILHGLALGLAMGALGCSLVLAFRRRDRLFAAHAAWLVGSMGYVACATGLGQQYLWTSASSGFNGKLDIAFALLAAASAASFLRHALATRTTASIFDGVLRALTIVAVTGLLVAPIATVSHHDLQQLTAIVAPMILAVGLPAAWLAHRRREAGATSALIGWSCLFVGTSLAIGVERGWLAANVLTLNAFELAFAAQIAAWTPALSLRARRVVRPASEAASQRATASPDTDELTGLPGRRGFSDILVGLLHERSEQTPTGLVAVYVVGFDEPGIAEGPEHHRTRAALLVQIARRIESVLRADDVVARLGGGDFAIAATRITDDRGAHALGQKLVAAFRRPIGLDNASYKLGVTIGYAVSPDHGEEPVRLMRRADLAMFDARRSPRGKLLRYDPQAWPVEEETAKAGLGAGDARPKLDDAYDAADATWCDTTIDDSPLLAPQATVSSVHGAGGDAPRRDGRPQPEPSNV